MAFLKGPISYIKPIFVSYITLLRSVYSIVVQYTISNPATYDDYSTIGLTYTVYRYPSQLGGLGGKTPDRPPIYQTLSISPKHTSIPVPSIGYHEPHNDSTNTNNHNDYISPTRTDCRPAHGDGDGNRGGNGGLTDFPSERKHSS